jgi:uncharacterized membrane protein YqjE
MSQSTSDFDPATQPRRPEATLGELFGEMTQNVTTLLRKEIELAKLETREEVSRVGRGAGMFAGAGLAAWLTLLFLSLGLAWLLDQAMNTALAFVIVGVLWGVVGAVLALRGKSEMKNVKPLPETVETLKEDVQWAKQQPTT